MSHLDKNIKMHYKKHVKRQLRVLLRLTLSNCKAICHYKNMLGGITGVTGTPDQNRHYP